MEGELQMLHDSGKRQEFKDGAVRDTAEGKGQQNLIVLEMIERLGVLLGEGAYKYSPHNWKAGIPYSRCMDSLIRHVFKYNAGMDDEDHLACAAANIMFLMWYEKHKPEMDDRYKE